MKARRELKDAFQNITEIFTAEDGGLRLLQVRTALERLDAQALDGDKGAEQIVGMFTNFGRLLSVLVRAHERAQAGK
jgi:hypothetical protein